ncbi:MAG: hypothetical protein AAGJ46_10965 [Planctomycetota bacterium]
MSSPPRQPSPAGYTLLELVFAVALVGGTLVPALALVRDSMELSLETDRRMLLTNYAISTLEQHLALVASTWATGVAEGDFATDGHANLRYTVSRSDQTIDGGIEDRLMHIRVTTYWDEDADDAQDADEKSCSLRTKIGKFASYESIATP